jgi:hypothetical protein
MKIDLFQKRIPSFDKMNITLSVDEQNKIKADYARELLKDTDWTQLADANLTEGELLLYNVYRLTLKSIITITFENCLEIDWPVNPGKKE